MRLNNLNKRHNLSCFDVNYLVIDLELTGLNSKQDEIVSLAWLPIVKQRIYVGKGKYFINSQVGKLKQSPIFHGLDTGAIEQGKPLNSALEQLVKLIDDSVLVFHNASLDWAFLLKAFKDYNISIPTEKIKSIVMIDTMKIEHRRLSRQSQDMRFDALNLERCRKRYHLPDYANHNAFTDAMATAELLLAQINNMSRSKALLIKQLL
ncbi:3'-5' exonuclease [Pseudoalteromonas denitrificans]|uniref:3'-5' exonuclease n=1 Tax=Pseudoalteromonas denitrificans TaxID=43656 RepID=UPI0015A6E040|nr:3'-5' exonuclease [Pseudoalteromonas denitrificans]